MASPSRWQEPLERAVRDQQLALGAFCGRCEYTLVYRKEADPLLYHGECLERLTERCRKGGPSDDKGKAGDK